MKKLPVFLLLFLITCGENTAITDENTATTTSEDKTTTTVPQPPTQDFDIIEIYNTKLDTELCVDAKEIDATTESCLKQYRDNLDNVYSYSETLELYITQLNNYLESYPTMITEEYRSLLQFVSTQYREIPNTYEIVSNKYIERFGGEPIVNKISINRDLWNECPSDITINSSENLKSGEYIYKNKIGESIKLNFQDKEFKFSKVLNVLGGNFVFEEGKVINYLDEEYSISSTPLESFYVNHWDAFFTNVEVVDLDNEQVTVLVEWEDGYLKLEAFSLLFQRFGLNEVNMNVHGVSPYGLEVVSNTNTSNMLDDAYKKTYLERSDNKIVVSYYFKENQNIELTEQPFWLTRIHSTNSQYDRKDIVYFYRFNDSRTKIIEYEFTRKVGCDGENSVVKKNNNFSISDKKFKLPFGSFESYYLQKY